MEVIGRGGGLVGDLEGGLMRDLMSDLVRDWVRDWETPEWELMGNPNLTGPAALDQPQPWPQSM